ncbi:hypothetical protein K450DRAFT_236682 [Umbelopsis ramanniana AG]|uniref:Protein kinase domain-containing protein n=1 Tax=Umbelopsis ramanniana AG TaxID=1314678 RepID=A0AAD5HDU3_UMBRA|nr:uncharacterized protein K450DRAFT_236682 [Umbelopsis ramanniana AG]KAI8580665.1 hypothetical protein K450DRAFT_236682 [Umbelopsis ramanniana AG]
MAASSLFSQWDRQKSLDLSLDLKTSSPSSRPDTPESNPSTSFIPIVVEPPQRVYIPQPNVENRKGFGLLRHDRHNMQNDEKPLSPIATSPGPNLLKVDENRKTSSRRPSLTSLLSLNRRSENATPSAEVTSLVSPSTPSQSPTTALQTPLLLEKYGICQDKSVGEGATAIIRLVRRRGHDTILAAKEFRKRSRNESERQYMKRMTSEFCISKPLDHENVIKTFDLLKDDRGRWCTVLEWCAGGDVFTVLKDVELTDDEIDCLFKQLVQGVHYLHTSGVAHRDIKPENLVLTATGTLKIIDFGVADVVQSCFEKESRVCAGYVGSEPFLSPEVFTEKEYDGKALDVWSTAITWYGMQHKALPFDKAKKEDAFYTEYLAARRQRNWPPLVLCNIKERECLYGMLDPDPTRRWTIERVLNCAWLENVETCQYAHTSSGAEHHHYIKALDKKS